MKMSDGTWLLEEIFIITAIILAGYGFFFTSDYIFKSTTAATPLDEPLSYDQEARIVALLEAAYSPDLELMEIKLQLSNSTFDGIDEYYFDADVLRGSKEKLEIKQVAHTEILIESSGFATFTTKWGQIPLMLFLIYKVN